MRRLDRRVQRLTSKTVQDFDVLDALRVVDDSGVAQLLEREMAKAKGRPRVHSWRSVLALFVLAALRQENGAHVVYTQKVWAGLTEKQRDLLGFTRDPAHSTIDAYLEDLSAASQESVDQLTGEVIPPRLSWDTVTLLSGLLRAATRGIAESPDQAVDSMPVSAWARRRGWKRDLAPDTSQGPAMDYGDVKPNGKKRTKVVSEPGWPIPLGGGAYQPTIDPDARDTFRGSKNLEPSGIVAGYKLHIACDVSPLGESDYPQIPRGFVLASGDEQNDVSALAMLTSMRSLGSCVSKVLVDRGYTAMAGWALPLSQQRIEQSLKLKANQMGARGTPVPGTVLIDGRLFVDWMPQDLWKLPNFELGMTEEETALLCERYEKRIPYAFEPKGQPDWDRGVQQFRGPAATGKVRCRNHPATLRLPNSKPECPSGEAGTPCACGAQPSLGPDDDLGLRQRYLYGTRKWWADHSRRSSIESANANVQTHLGNLGARQAIRITSGLVKRAWMTCFALIASVIRLMRSRYGRTPSNVAPGEVLDTPLPRPAKTVKDEEGNRRRKAQTLNVKVFGRRKPRRSSGVERPSAPPGRPQGPPPWAQRVPESESTA